MTVGNCMSLPLKLCSSRAIVVAFAIFPTYLKSHQQNVAGAEGFEPPSPVLETGSLAVELTPLRKHT